jgi:signal transduction histidine kinase/CheY-like chemotaxis protein
MEDISSLSEQLSEENRLLKEENKKLAIAAKKAARNVSMVERQLRGMEMSYTSRNVMYRSQIAENDRQRRFLTGFMNSSQNFVIFLDEELRIAYISKKLLSQIGAEFEETVTGMNIADFCERYFSPAHTDKILSAIDTVSITMKPIEHDVTVPSENGEDRYYSVVCNPMKAETADDENSFSGIIIIYYDQTEIMSTMMQAMEANNAKSRFLATMSHEIRTPMNAIIGISDIELSRANSHDKKSIEALETISRSAHSLLGIINDILDLSKAETGKLELVNSTFDFGSMLNDTVVLNITRIGSKPIRFSLYFEGDIPAALIGDELRIKQILSNVLSNAFKYTDKGTVKLGIKATSADGTAQMTFTITDTGQGMRPEDLKTLFDEYSRFNNMANRKTEGTGLGMNITYRLVSMMGGSITAESEFGKGTTFTVTLPLRLPEQVNFIPDEAKSAIEHFRYQSQSEKSNRIVYDDLSSGRVLVVDDVETNLIVADGLISPYGIQCEKVTSGQKAIDLINAGNTYDIIFMDHMMPVMDGIEATQLIRVGGYTGVIIALTANAIAGNDKMFIDNGFNDFISKPIDTRILDKALHTYIKSNGPFAPAVTDSTVASREVSASTVASGSISTSASAQSTYPTAPAPRINPELLRVFLRDAHNALITMHEQLQNNDLKNFAITVHGMKSALANVGEADVSAMARDLEFAAKDEDSAYITERYPEFKTALEESITRLTPDKQHDGEAIDSALLREKIAGIKAAAEDYDSNAADVIIAELQTFSLPDGVGEKLSAIGELILHGEFEEAAQACTAFSGE